MIKINNINKEYVGQNAQSVALRNISLTFKDTGLVIISGRSGSGKTTLLNMIAGLDKPSSGEIITSYKKDVFYSFVFQDFQLIDYLTIEENLRLVKNFDVDIKDFEELVKKYELFDILTHYPNQISGGEKQRVAIVRAILMDRPVILCDEPTGNLDEDNAIIVSNMLKDVSKEKLVIVVTHDLDVFEGKQDRLIKLNKGLIEEDIDNSSNYKSNIQEDADIIFNKKTKFVLMKKFVRKNKIRYSFLFISLLLSILLLFASINIFVNKDYVVVNDTYASEKIIVDFSKYDKSNNAYYSLSKIELDKMMNKYDSKMYYYDFKSADYYKGIIVNRIYVSNYTNQKIIYGDDKLEDNDIIISDYNAYKLSNDLSSLIGMELGKYTISGIFETNFESYKDSDNDYFYSVCYAIYVNKESLINYVNDYNIISYYKSNDRINEFEVYKSKNNIAIFGENTNLNDNEVGISENFAQNYATDLSSLIGNKITIDFVNYLERGNNSNIEIISKDYTIKYIYQNKYDEDEISLNENSYNEIAVDVCSTLNNRIANGFSVDKFNQSIVKELMNAGFKDNTYLTSDIDAGIDWVYNISLIAIVVGIIMFIISILILSNFIHNIFTSEKRTIGVLVSFGILKSKVSTMYFNTIFGLATFCYIIVMVLNIFIVIALNLMIRKLVEIKTNVVYYNPITIFISLLPILFIMLFALLIINNRMKKKTIIDIIYER